jgi:hypothetical protein
MLWLWKNMNDLNILKHPCFHVLLWIITILGESSELAHWTQSSVRMELRSALPVLVCSMKWLGWIPELKSQGKGSFLLANPEKFGNQLLVSGHPVKLCNLPEETTQRNQGALKTSARICLLEQTRTKVASTCFSSSVQIIWKLVDP